MVEHMLDDLLDDDGWIVAVCACGLASGPCPDAATAANFWGQHLLHVTRGEVQRQALIDAANDWTGGAWADTPRHADRAADRIAASQYAGDWLRARAAALNGPSEVDRG